MTAKADPGEVAAADPAGSLHPSQRGVVFDALFWAVWCSPRRRSKIVVNILPA
ncbi:hypothetical protein [Amycolatopsis sp. Poz14]|uniref:hypothetical protein n=1 Tax=Amycolatopsis sp. Poz14 TaxID=1447705 RepID=UPI001EE88A5D|nr:hypothetical protein [Amycolatopsis sp. Poz14]MCG3752435.1 hypothetical protein [Amycolatopsis sp. Poz14]